MTSDRDLLEAAANATGQIWKWTTCPKFGEQVVPGIHHRDHAHEVDYYPGWNPLEDSEDAFKLMVQLKISIGFIADTHVYTYKYGYPERTCKEFANSSDEEDINAAVRLAIVKMAVRIFIDNNK